ncbi:hypothetical protein GCM10025867_36270 [Frondihabitans sucicola]|uniref:DUF2809 domain-containing protein n=1 Tax=Frondihabitans sucicola TaxID=1268041 RepID=A0ABM8GSE7_9MICO|nr:DUF2809 domain-containing protein [Frondihabitans sucicola]BDZ51386.1 hypothetical protein GCM10025867_36270 [Frondihabitans sucicola]
MTRWESPHPSVDEPAEHAARAAVDLRARRSRPLLVLAGCLVVAMGIVSKVAVPGLFGDLLGSGCYTALLVVLAAFVAPRAPGAVLALVAFAISSLVELLQLSSIPRDVVEVVPLSEWVLGTTFVATDLVGYAAGAVAAFAVDRAVGRRRRRVGR